MIINLIIHLSLTHEYDIESPPKHITQATREPEVTKLLFAPKQVRRFSTRLTFLMSDNHSRGERAKTNVSNFSNKLLLAQSLL